MRGTLIRFYILICLFPFTIKPQETIPQYLRDAYAPLLLMEMDANHNLERTSDSILTVLGRWPWGMCYAVNALYNYIYMGNGPTLHILDISNAAAPEIVGAYSSDRLITNIIVKDKLAYLGAGRYLEILDIENPLNPINLGEVVIPPGTSGPLRIAVEDTLAFVTTFGLIWTIDVADPTQPQIRQAIAAGGDIPNCLAANEHYAYVGNPGYPNLIIVDATNPDSLNWAGELEIGGWGESAVVTDSLLYVGVRGFFTEDFLKIYDVSDPAFPGEISGITIPKTDSLHMGILSLTVVDNIAYLATHRSGIFSIDVTNPALPVIMDNVEKPNGTLQGGHAITFAGETLFAAYSSGLWIIDAAQPGFLKDLYFFPTCQYANKVVLKKDLAFIACGYSGLWVLDISDPYLPVQISNINTGGWTADVVVSDSFAYVANYGLETVDTTRGLWVINISDVQHLQIQGHHIGIAKEALFSAHHNTLDRYGDLIFMTGANWPRNDSILQIIDVSDPSYPSSVSVVRAPYTPYYVAVQDSFSYLATPDSGLRIVDWHDPEQPVEVSHLLDSAGGIVTNDSLAYVLTNELSVVDISNPYYPSFLGSTDITSSVTSLDGDVSGNFVYWVAENMGVVDVSEPSLPRQITTFGNYSFSGVAVQNELIALTNSESGVWILRNNLITAINEEVNNTLLKKFELYQNYPNPFNPQTTIEFYAPYREKIVIEVFNILGQKVKTLLNEEVTAGRHSLIFDSSGLPSGVYFYRLKAPNASLTQKMVILQ